MSNNTYPQDKLKFKVAVVQHECVADIAENISQSMKGIRQASDQGAKLVLLQELHSGLYFCQQENDDNFELAENIPGPCSEQFSVLAAELGIVIVISLFEKRAAGLYHNTAVVLDSDGSIAGKYRKMHIPDDPGFHEKFYFTPGDLGFTPIQTSIGKLGVLICWDQWFPEAARIMTLAGADLLLYPTAIGWDMRDTSQEQTRQLDAWLTVQRAHAIANSLPVLCANRSGLEKHPNSTSEPGIQFWGNSFICGQQGEILAQATDSTETVLISEINLDRTDKIRRIWPYLRDRRIDAYDNISSRFSE